jgi:hypothetical protein
MTISRRQFIALAGSALVCTGALMGASPGVSPVEADQITVSFTVQVQVFQDPSYVGVGGATVMAADLGADGTVVVAAAPDSFTCAVGVCSYVFNLRTPSASPAISVYAVDYATGKVAAADRVTDGTTTVLTVGAPSGSVQGTVKSADRVTALGEAQVVVRNGAGAVTFVTRSSSISADGAPYPTGAFRAQSSSPVEGSVTVSPPQDDVSHGSEMTWELPQDSGIFALDGRSVFGQVVGTNGTTQIVGADVRISRVDGTDAELFAGTTDSSGEFAASIAFVAGRVYRLTVTPTSQDEGAASTFTIPGPVGTLAHPETFQLNDGLGDGVGFQTRHWRCVDATDTNCVVSLEYRGVGDTEWLAATAPTHATWNGNWDSYEVWATPNATHPGTDAHVTTHDMRVQFWLRPVDLAEDGSGGSDYPYINIEMYSQVDGFHRDGWGCDSNGIWAGYDPENPDVDHAFGCPGGAPLDPIFEYRVTLRTSQDGFEPLFVQGYMSDMATGLQDSSGNYELTVSGAPSSWQFTGDSPDSQYFAATNRDWSFQVYDGRTYVTDWGFPISLDCLGQGVAASSTNGNGGNVPSWDEQQQTLTFGTNGRHLKFDGNVYYGQARMVVPTALAECMWGLSYAELSGLTGGVYQPVNGELIPKVGAEVGISVDPQIVDISASGYTYSEADLVVSVRSAAPAAPAAPVGAPEESAEVVTATVTKPPTEGSTGNPAPWLPRNPLTPVHLTTSLTVVSQAEADAAVVRTMVHPPASNLGGAPRLPASVGKAISLVVPGLVIGHRYAARIKVAGRYLLMGATSPDSRGLAALPVFKTNRPGAYTVALIDEATGVANYIKVVVVKGSAAR